MEVEPIKYKDFYNKDRGLPEPIWGSPTKDVQCPWCSSQDMFFSAHPDDPEEILGCEGSVRCRNCGHITDWYEALKQRESHPTEEVKVVVKC